MNQPTEPQVPIWFQSQDLRISLPEPDVRLVLDVDPAEARLRHGEFWEVYEFIGQELATGLLTLGQFLRTVSA